MRPALGRECRRRWENALSQHSFPLSSSVWKQRALKVRNHAQAARRHFVGQWEHSKRVDAAILPAEGSDTMRKLILLLFICLIPLPALALDMTVGDVTT